MSNLILALDIGGTPHSWLTWQDAVTLKYKNLIAWEIGKDEYMYRGGQSRMTGEQSVVEVSSIVAIKSKFSVRNRTPALNNKNLFRRDLNVCAYCGDKFHDNILTRDHILPVSRWGANTWMNCVTACVECNNKKADRTPEEANMLLRYVPYAPDRAEGLILQNRSIMTDQMEFLVHFLPKHSRMHTLMN